MKAIHKILLGVFAIAALSVATPANAYTRHGKYVYRRGHYGYYYAHAFYPYNAGPHPYYYGPYYGPGVVVAPAPAVVVRSRHHFLFFSW